MTTQLLPTTMVGSYPRPGWFTNQLMGRDVLEAFKDIHHREAFEDAVRTVLVDQEQAGLDILSDGQMWFDDYSMGIGSFLWYWLERIGGFSPEKVPHPAASKAQGRDVWALDQAGGVRVVGRGGDRHRGGRQERRRAGDQRRDAGGGKNASAVGDIPERARGFFQRLGGGEIRQRGPDFGRQIRQRKWLRIDPGRQVYPVGARASEPGHGRIQITAVIPCFTGVH